MDSSRFKSDPYNPKNRLFTLSDIKEIEQKIHMSIPVSDIQIYQKAFIHTSYTELSDYEEYERPDDCLPLYSQSYETMEFLGDSLLGSIVSTYLYERYVPVYLG